MAAPPMLTSNRSHASSTIAHSRDGGVGPGADCCDRERLDDACAATLLRSADGVAGAGREPARFRAGLRTDPLGRLTDRAAAAVSEPHARSAGGHHETAGRQ